MFQIKDFVSIVAGMINRAKATQNKVTDFNIGSVARTMLEAPGVEIDELYQQMWNGLKESIPVAIYNSFEFAALPAVPATGMVRVTITPAATDTLVAGGVRFTTNDGSSTAFAAILDTVIPAGSTYADLKIVAVTPGISGNISIGTTFSLTPLVTGFVSAIAISGFVDGSNIETLDERKVRFIDYVSTLNRGTVSAIRYGAKQAKIVNANGLVTEAVRNVVILEPWLTDPARPVALVECYIFNGVDGASSNLLAETLKQINGYVDANGVRVSGWKAAGVKVDVIAATLVAVAVTATVVIGTTYAHAPVIQAIKDAISDYISKLDIGDDVLVAELVSAAMNIPGVENFHITIPSADVAIATVEKATTGTLTITAV